MTIRHSKQLIPDEDFVEITIQGIPVLINNSATKRNFTTQGASKTLMKIPDTPYYVYLSNLTKDDILEIAGIKYYDVTFDRRLAHDPKISAKIKKYGRPISVYDSANSISYKLMFENQWMKLALKEISKAVRAKKIKLAGLKASALRK